MKKLWLQMVLFVGRLWRRFAYWRCQKIKKHEVSCSVIPSFSDGVQWNEWALQRLTFGLPLMLLKDIGQGKLLRYCSECKWWEITDK